MFARRQCNSRVHNDEQRPNDDRFALYMLNSKLYGGCSVLQFSCTLTAKVAQHTAAFNARRYASAVYAVVMCPSVCTSVRHRPVLSNLIHQRVIERKNKQTNNNVQ